MKTFKEIIELSNLTEAVDSFDIIAVNRVSKTSANPVGKDTVKLTQKQIDFLTQYGKKETIQGDDYIVLNRDYKTDSKIKTPNINKVGRTSGYNELLIKATKLTEAVEKQKYTVIAVNRVSKTTANPVGKDVVELTAKNLEFLAKYGKKETIQGDDYIVLNRDYKTDSKIKTPNINKVGRTSGYTELFFKAE